MTAFRFVRVLCLLAAGTTLLSCADIASPSRSEAYEWRRFVPNIAGSVDTLSFHWPRSSLPVKVWAEDTLNLLSHTRHGLDQWEAAFLYGEFAAILVSDSSTADVIVRNGLASKGDLNITRLQSHFAPECEGGTDVELSPDGHQIQLPIRVFVEPRFDPTLPGVDECMALTTTHELGHAIGIFAHSPATTDIMYSDPAVSSPSSPDRATAEVAYHTKSTLTLRPR